MLKSYFETKLALGCDTTFVLVAECPPEQTSAIFADLWRATFMFERRFSRFLPASELSLFNRFAGVKTPVSPDMHALLTAARNLGVRTNGLFNPFVLPALQRAGYVNSLVPNYANDSHDSYATRRIAPVAALEIGDGWARIPFGTALDLGGCGKGYLADQLAARLPRHAVQGFWLSLGGDIIAGGHNEHGQPWTVQVQDAEHPEATCEQALQGTTRPFAVATSGTIVRRGQHNGKSWHHIIDPRSGQPATTGVRLATVRATTALDADVLASCAVILGADRAPAWLRRHGVYTGVLQMAHGQIKTFGTGLVAVPQPEVNYA